MTSDGAVVTNTRNATHIMQLILELRDHGSWCGETHLQKAAFLLTERYGIHLDMDFVLYKYGPFSFALRDELREMLAEGMVDLEPQGYPYGPRLKVNDYGIRYLSKHQVDVEATSGEMSEVAEYLGGRGVSSLERLATAVLLVRRDPEAEDEKLAMRLNQVKPHVSLEAARKAIGDGREFLDRGKMMGQEAAFPS